MMHTATTPASRAAPPVHRMDPRQLEAHLITGRARVVDVRDTATIDQAGHVPGASHWSRLGAAAIADDGCPCIVYGYSEEDSRQAAEELADLGVQDVAWLADGFRGWGQAELPVAGLAPWHARSIPSVPLVETRTS